MKQDDPFAVVEAQIKSMAADAFKCHVVREVAVEPCPVFRCSAPGTWCYGFFVAFLPGAIAFWGDVGDEMIFRRFSGSGFDWLRGAVRSRDYLLEKAGSHARCDWYVPDALAWLEAVAADADDTTFEPARNVLRDGDASPDDFARELSKIGLLDGGLPGMEPSSGALWSVEALRWFCAHVWDDKTGGVK